jgi:hypothetical protein
MNRRLMCIVLLAGSAVPCAARSDDAQLRRQAAKALRRATEFFTTRVAT